MIDGVKLQALRNLGLIEAHIKKFNLLGPVSHISVSVLIDNICVSCDITPAEVSRSQSTLS